MCTPKEKSLIVKQTIKEIKASKKKITDKLIAKISTKNNINPSHIKAVLGFSNASDPLHPKKKALQLALRFTGSIKPSIKGKKMAVLCVNEIKDQLRHSIFKDPKFIVKSTEIDYWNKVIEAINSL